MTLTIVDLPRVFVRLAAVDWDIDWGAQSLGADIAGGDQPSFNAFPRFRGSLPFVLPHAMIPEFRALRWSLQGRIACWRVPMVDPLTVQTAPGAWQQELRAWQQGYAVEPRPKVRAVATASRGATTIVVDESMSAPQDVIKPGQFMSYADWPFAVLSRAGSGSAVTLRVALLRVTVPEGAEIDLEARGLFRMDDPRGGNPTYDTTRVARPSVALTEVLTR